MNLLVWIHDPLSMGGEWGGGNWVWVVWSNESNTPLPIFIINIIKKIKN